MKGLALRRKRGHHKKRQSLSGLMVHGALEGLSRAARLHPLANPARHGVSVERDVAYRPARTDVFPTDAHLLDVYRRDDGPRRGVMLYLHGGGFRILSKETHWVMALGFAREGYDVYTPNYRLAPRHRYPAAIEDCADALCWVLDHAGPIESLVLAGESAGANLAAALTIAATFERPEPWAQAVYARAPKIHALLPACGIFGVTDLGRFGQRGIVQDRINEVGNGYRPLEPDADLAMCDVMRFLLDTPPSADRPWPPSFLIGGQLDVIKSDTLAMRDAIAGHTDDVSAKLYPKGIHAFHAFVWAANARAAWRDQLSFLERCHPDASTE